MAYYSRELLTELFTDGAELLQNCLAQPCQS